MAEKTQKSESSTDVPSVKEHLRQSWEMTVASLKNLIFAWLTAILVAIGAVLLVVIVGIAVGSLGTVSKINSFDAFLSFMTSPMAMVIVLLAVIVMIAFSIFSSGLSAAVIIALAKYEEKLSFGEVFGKGMKLALPVFLLGILMGLITSGGTFLLIIPGIAMAIFLSFSMYEKVLQNKSITDSFKGSYTMVKNNFGLIFVRWLVIVALYFALFILLPEILGAMSEGLKGLYNIVTSLGGVLAQWIMMAYFIILYQQVRKKTDMTKLDGITWMWLVAAVGWLVIITVGVALANQIPKWIDMANQAEEKYSSMDDGAEFKKMMDEMNVDTDTNFNFDVDLDTTGLSPDNKQAIEDTQAAMEDYVQQMQQADEATQQ